MRWVAALALFVLLLAVGSGQGRAQGSDVPDVRSPVLTIDPDRLFSESLFGLRIIAETNAAREALASENRRIEADLTAEEQGLTTRRPTMDPEAFRAEATAFDEKVQGIRRAQDAKERALQSGIATGRDQFFVVVREVLAQMMAARNAAVILDRRAVFLGVGVVDITDEAVAQIDAAIGDGSSLFDPVPVPDPVPAPMPSDN